MKTEDKLKELWKGAIKKDGWGYDIVEADADGILKITAKWIDKNFSPVEPEVIRKNLVGYLINYGILKGDKIFENEKPTHGTCCTCQECGRNYDDCVCESNKILTEINKIFSV